ncbi:MAG: FCD domain-containing protein [Chloroflexi bacterium]|nr:FCD domain-containing protein [Chloroflexota bacterium]
MDILDKVAQLGDDPTPDACSLIVKLDEEFHRWLLRESGNRNLERIVGRLLDQLFRSRSFNIAQDYPGGESQFAGAA